MTFKNYFSKTIPWIDPVDIAFNVYNNEQFMCFLYSSKITNESYHSYIAYSPLKHLKSDQFADTQNIDDDEWFGYLGYDLKNSLETLPIEEFSTNTLPSLWLIKYQFIIEFNHITNTAIFFYQQNFDEQYLKTTSIKLQNYQLKLLKSNMTKQEYLAKVQYIKNMIEQGVVYQANLTRKFFGEFDEKSNQEVNNFVVFKKLFLTSPSSYSAILKFDKTDIISSSPELFLRVANKQVITKPIKGTIKRESNKVKDAIQLETIQNSFKDKSENLMIVDLMRNDLAKVCEPESIQVPALFATASFATLHHLYSEIIGKIAEPNNNLDLIKACFPPGSMTGTPKIKSIELCSTLEKYKRGVYSGCIGRISKNGNLELSVVIRTLIINKGNFEFQVGGAIVYDSEPISEWNETLVKAKAIAKVLGISLNTLKGI